MEKKMNKIIRSATFKKKVALDALKVEKTLGQLASQHGIHPMLVSNWKKELINGAESIFEDKRS
jgi:transposase-like protein